MLLGELALPVQSLIYRACCSEHQQNHLNALQFALPWVFDQKYWLVNTNAIFYCLKRNRALHGLFCIPKFSDFLWLSIAAGESAKFGWNIHSNRRKYIVLCLFPENGLWNLFRIHPIIKQWRLHLLLLFGYSIECAGRTFTFGLADEVRVYQWRTYQKNDGKIATLKWANLRKATGNRDSQTILQRVRLVVSSLRRMR